MWVKDAKNIGDPAYSYVRVYLDGGLTGSDLLAACFPRLSPLDLSGYRLFFIDSGEHPVEEAERAAVADGLFGVQDIIGATHNQKYFLVAFVGEGCGHCI